MTNNEVNSNDETRMGMHAFSVKQPEVPTNPVPRLFVIRASSFLHHLVSSFVTD